MHRWLTLAVVAACLGACALAGSNLRPGVDLEADVVRAMGPASLAIPVPGGRRQLAYATGPLGIETWMVYISREGRFERIEQVLREEQFQRIVANVTTQEEVLRLIGPPSRKVDFDNLGQVAWDYRFRDAWGYFADFSVMIDRQGRVAGKFTARMEPREGSGFAR